MKEVLDKGISEDFIKYVGVENYQNITTRLLYPALTYPQSIVQLIMQIMSNLGGVKID